MTDGNELGAAPVPASKASPKKRKKHKGYLGCIFGLSLGLSGLAASRLGHLWVDFDVFSQFTLQFLIATLAFTSGLFMPRAKVFIALLIFVCLSIGVSVWPYHASQHVKILSTVASNERELNVASFNSWLFNNDVDAIKAEVARIDADVITLVEIGQENLGVIDALKAQYPYAIDCRNTGHCNFAMLSKYPLNDISSQMIWLGPPYIRASLGPDFGGVTIFGVHTTRFPHSRAQFKQINALAAELSKGAGPQIVMGDFNATPFSRVTETLSRAANMTRLTNLPTWPARLGLPQVAIDHIFVSPGIRQLTSESIGNNAGSDHFPIFLKLAVPVK